MDKILLIDGNNAIWRASIGFGPTKSIHVECLDCDALISIHREGKTHCECGEDWNLITNSCLTQPSSEYVTVFNSFRNLRPLIEMFSPDKCYFVLEGHPKFRYDLFADYKANRIIKNADRKEDLEKFNTSSNHIIRLLKYLPITIARAADYECDDVIGTLCENLKDEDLTVLSGDSDFIQLLQRGYKNCKVYSPIKKSFMVAPDYPYVAWKCLAGDKSDSIPGFEGIGDKKAQKMLKDPDKFRSFMEIEENRSKFSIFRQLIEFKSVPEEEISLVEGIKNFLELKKEFKLMQFESIINDNSWNKYIKTFDCLKF